MARVLHKDDTPVHARENYEDIELVKETEKIVGSPAVAAGEEVKACSRCGRKFGVSRVALHEGICQKISSPAKLLRKGEGSPSSAMRRPRKEPVPLDDASLDVERSLKKHALTELTANSPERVACAVCGHKFPSARLSMHQEKCSKAFLPSGLRKRAAEAVTPAKPSSRVLHSDDTPAKGLENYDDEGLVKETERIAGSPAQTKSVAQLIRCRVCERGFAVDRIGIHEGICKKSSATASARSRRQLIGEVMVATPYPSRRRLHDDSTPVSARESYDDADLIKQSEDVAGSPATPGYGPRVACQFCGRRFAARRIGVHEEICKKLSQSAPPPKKGIGRVNCKYCARAILASRIDMHEELCKKTIGSAPARARERMLKGKPDDGAVRRLDFKDGTL